MRVLDNELKDKKIVYKKLLEYGFVKEKNFYIYQTKLLNNQFEMLVIVKENKMSSKLIDLESNKEYFLVDVKSSNGAFVSNLRNEYEKNLTMLIDSCTISYVFKSANAKEVIKYIKEKYNDDLEFLFEKSPDNAIIRNKINNKWYALLLKITEDKLGFSSSKKIEILNLRYQKDKIKDLLLNPEIYPAYHMNKNNWITIVLDNNLKKEKLLKLIDNSYNISLKK